VATLIISTMEQLLSPCTRFNEILESQGRLEQLRIQPSLELLRIRGCEEIRELNLDVSTEELLSAERAFTYENLYRMIGNEDTVAWLTPHAAVVRNHETGTVVNYWIEGHISVQLDEPCGLCFKVDGKEVLALALSPEHLLEICDVVLRLLAVSVVHSVVIYEWICHDGALINAPALAYLMEQCQSLKFLSLVDLKMDENHCRVLDDFSRPDLEIVLVGGDFTDAGATTLAEVLGRDQGPTKIINSNIDNFVLANGLRGNSRLKSLSRHFSSSPEYGNREVLAIADALRENKGLVELNLACQGFKVSDEAWGAISDSLETHPTLEVLNLRGTLINAAKAPSVLKSRIQALVDMMKVNMSIHTIQVDDHYYEHKLFKESVIPYLETNRLRPRLLAIQKTLPQAYRAEVLGRALLAVRTDPNRFWMLLSGNAEVAFPSTTATITTAGSLPAPANAVATENVAPVVAIASVTTASSVVAYVAGQKRKAYP
jgi:hypothetical protein